MGILLNLLGKFLRKRRLAAQFRSEEKIMNIDDPNDHRDLNIELNNYLVTEVVAVPPNFDIHSYLSMREQIGMFKTDKVNLKQIEIISLGVTCSPIFSSMNNPVINAYSVGYFLYILDELGLIIKSHHSPLRKTYSGKSYLEFCKNWQNERYQYIRGQEVKRMSFVIINIVQLLQKHIIDEAEKALKDIENYQDTATKKMEEILNE